MFIDSFTEPSSNLFKYNPCYLGNSSTPLKVVEYKSHNKRWVAKIDGNETPENARHLTHQEITITRESLPPLKNHDEFYWCDLIGFNIYNLDHDHLGEITSFFETGSNDVMIVKKTNGSETYIPFLKRFITEIDPKQKKITMNWKD